MENLTLQENLMLYGLTRIEATIYLCLYTDGEMTGYEVSKKTGISRSNVYTGLADLVDAGAAYICGGSANKYRAVEIEEFCDNRMKRLAEAKTYLKENLHTQAAFGEGYITITGAPHIEDKVIHMLRGAEKRIYLSAPIEKIAKLKDELLDLCEKKIKVVIIAEMLPEELGNKVDKGIIFYQIKSEKDKDDSKTQTKSKTDQIRLIIDSAYVLTGDMKGENSDTCLYSDQTNFVAVFKEAMHNEIELIELRRKEANL